jgi:hypothetical protein
VDHRALRDVQAGRVEDLEGQVGGGGAALRPRLDLLEEDPRLEEALVDLGGEAV